MNHRQIEMDIGHLEQIIRHVSAANWIPLAYWRNRIDSVSSHAVIPAQQNRLRRINAQFAELEAAELQAAA